jgi:hypothetical protein
MLCIGYFGLQRIAGIRLGRRVDPMRNVRLARLADHG